MPATHTPAPWTVTDQHSDYVMSVVRRGNGMSDLQTGSEADAALIAAAPDLLAALKGMFVLLDAGSLYEPQSIAARAAIAKATAQ